MRKENKDLANERKVERVRRETFGRLVEGVGKKRQKRGSLWGNEGFDKKRETMKRG